VVTPVTATLKRVLLADDHAVLREGLKALLENRGFLVVGEACDGQQAARLAEHVLPDLAILDFGMPLMNGVATAVEIQRVSPATRIIILSVHDEGPYVLDALRAGIRGYVLKSCAADELVAAIREVAAGNIYLTPRISGAVVNGFLSRTEPEPERLTPRERQVLQLVAEGHTSKEVGAQLGVSQKTAESHRTNIMEKLGIHHTPGLVRYAIRRGLIEAVLLLFLGIYEDIATWLDFALDIG
jgi:DNA-binding NarL/FixJ family response regulator